MRQTALLIAAFVAGILLTIAVIWFLVLRPRAPEAPTPPATVEAPVQLPADIRFFDRFASLDSERYWISERGPSGAWMENDFRARQLLLEPHGLTVAMEANAEGARNAYRSGEIQTNERFRYGYFEARMRVPRGDGVITGLFTYVASEQGQSQQEVDIELLGQDPTELHTAYHVGGRSYGERVPLPFDASRDFHTYGFEWTPTAIRWYVDNDMVHEATGPSVEAMTRPQNLFLNLWGTDRLYQWAGRMRRDESPWRLEVTCVASAEHYPGRALCPATPQPE